MHLVLSRPDLAGGYAQWALVSCIVHGLEGLLMALVLKAMKHSMASKILAAAICILIVPAGYYVLSGLFLVGFEAALADIPGNFIQSIVGAIVGFALSEAVIKAYPPVKSFAW